MFIDSREGERGREREKHRWVAFCMRPTWELNPQPFGAQDDTPTSWAVHPELKTGPSKSSLQVTFHDVRVPVLSLNPSFQISEMLVSEQC